MQNDRVYLNRHQWYSTLILAIHDKGCWCIAFKMDDSLLKITFDGQLVRSIHIDSWDKQLDVFYRDDQKVDMNMPDINVKIIAVSKFIWRD